MSERWIVDAMNVIGSRPDGWWKDRDAAMRDFAQLLDDHASNTGRQITVVFDSDPGSLPQTAHIEIVIARGRGRNAADDEIDRLVTEADDAADVRVVTSDRDLVEKVTRAGAGVMSSGMFRKELERSRRRS